MKANRKSPHPTAIFFCSVYYFANKRFFSRHSKLFPQKNKKACIYANREGRKRYLKEK